MFIITTWVFIRVLTFMVLITQWPPKCSQSPYPCQVSPSVHLVSPISLCFQLGLKNPGKKNGSFFNGSSFRITLNNYDSWGGGVGLLQVLSWRTGFRGSQAGHWNLDKININWKQSQGTCSNADVLGLAGLGIKQPSASHEGQEKEEEEISEAES